MSDLNDDIKKYSGLDLIVDLVSAIIFGVAIIGMATFVERFTPDSTATYPIKLATVILTVILAAISKLKLPKAFSAMLGVITIPVFMFVFELITGAWSASVSNDVVLVFMCIMNLLYLVWCIAKPRKDKLTPAGMVFAIVINYLVYLSMTQFAYEDVEVVLNPTGLFIDVFIAFFAFFIGRQISELEDGYYHSMRASAAPLNELRSRNMKTIIIVVIGFILGILAMLTIDLGFVSESISYFVGVLLLEILKLISKYGITEELEVGERPQRPQLQSDGATDSTLFFTIFLSIFLLIALGALIYYIAKHFGNKTHRKKLEPQSEFIVDVIEEIPVSQRKKRKTHDFGSGHEREIRKKFYSAVRKAISHGAEIKTSDSPQQIAEAVKNSGSESIDELTKEYEDIRYM